MSNSLVTLIRSIHKLPESIVKEVFNYIIPNSDKIEFRNGYTYKENYCDKYMAAFISNERVNNKNGIYLVRLCKKNLYKKNKPKKNDTYKYYFIKEFKDRYCEGCGVKDCSSQYCRGGFEYNTYFVSKYVSNNIDYALLNLYYYTNEDIRWIGEKSVY